MKNIICYEFDIHDGSSRINLMLQHYFGFLAIYGQSKKKVLLMENLKVKTACFCDQREYIDLIIRWSLVYYHCYYFTFYILHLFICGSFWLPSLALPQLAWNESFFLLLLYPLVTYDLVDCWCFSVMLLLCRWYVHWGTEWAGRISCRDVVWADSCTLHSDQ